MSQLDTIHRVLKNRRLLKDAVYRIEQSLFDKQLQVVREKSKYVVVKCGRRAGKTNGARAMAAMVALERDGIQIPVIELTRTCAAAEEMWRGLIEMNEKFELHGKPDNRRMRIDFPNRSRIFIVGGCVEREINKIRGTKYPFALIDEVGAFPPSVLKSLVVDVVIPALADYRGSLWMVGTPPPTPEGMFSKPPKGWAKHHWTMLDNPYIPHAQEWLDELKEQMGWEDDNPTLLREYYGLDVYDIDSLIYRYDIEKNRCAMDFKADGYVLGIDFGYVDATAFSVLAYSIRHNRVHVVESWKKTRMIPSDVADAIAEIQTRYVFDAVVGDVNGQGKAYVEEFHKRYETYIEPATKMDKEGHVSYLSGDLVQGNLTIDPDKATALHEEWITLRRSDKRGQFEDPACENHCADATLYAYMKCLQWLPSRVEKPEPDLNQIMLQQAVERSKRNQDPYFDL